MLYLLLLPPSLLLLDVIFSFLSFPFYHRFYRIAHTIQEKILELPMSLKGGELREYQRAGVEWLLSLYNNKLNGILADEMGLGKTVQSVALIAYLMEFKKNYGQTPGVCGLVPYTTSF